MVKVSNTVQLITPEQAKIWLEQKYEHQRPISSTHVENLARAMQDGTFAPVSSIMFAVLKGVQCLINGQQTLSAIIKSKISQTLPVVFYEVDSDKEVAELYFRIDRQRQRNLGDSIRATDLPRETGLSPSVIKVTMSALRHMRGNFGTNREIMRGVSDDDLVSWMPNWTWEVNMVRNSIMPCGDINIRMIEQQAVLSVAMITMRYQTQKAREFWRQVAQDDGLQKYDPRKTIRNYLISIRAAYNQTKRVRAHEISRSVILAWNAYYEGRNLRYVQPRDITSPVRILGTVFSGVQADNFVPLYPSPALEQKRLELSSSS